MNIKKCKLEYLIFSKEGYISKFGNSCHNTKRSKTIDLDQFLKHVVKFSGEKTPTLDAVSAITLSTWITQLLSSYSASSVKRKIATLKHFFNVLQREFNYRCPLDKFPTVSATPPMIARVTREQLAEARHKLSGRDYRSLRDRAMFEVTLGTGLRAHEVMSLTLEQIDFTKCIFTMVKRKGKKIKDQPFPHQITHYLRDYLKVRKTYATDSKLWLHPTGNHVAYSYLQRLMRKHGFNAHQLRHESAKRVYEASDLMTTRDFLGHSSAVTTERYLEREQNYINDKVNKAYF